MLTLKTTGRKLKKIGSCNKNTARCYCADFALCANLALAESNKREIDEQNDTCKTQLTQYLFQNRHQSENAATYQQSDSLIIPHPNHHLSLSPRIFQLYRLLYSSEVTLLTLSLQSSTDIVGRYCTRKWINAQSNI